MSRNSTLLLSLVLLLLAGPSSHPTLVEARPNAVFTPNDTGDATDANPGDGVCETGTGNGICTLRAAIQEANALPGTDLIILPSGTYTLTIPGANEDSAATGDLDITDNLILIGSGPELTIIDGNQLDRVFDIFSPAIVTIAGVTIRNGASSIDYTGGGAIRNRSPMFNLNNSLVLSNTALYGGGGIYNLGLASLDNVTISKNLVNRDFDYNADGGGVLNYGGTFIIDHSLIFSNTAFSHGGGIHNLEGNLVISNSQILSNTVTDLNSGIGGGIVSGSYYAKRVSIASLTNVLVNGNSSRLHAGVLNFGIMTATKSHIDNNIGLGEGGFYPGLANGGPMILDRVTVNGNTARNGAGLVNGFASITVMNSTIANNISNAGESHAGLINLGTAVLDNVRVVGNSAAQTSGLVNVGIMTLTNGLVSDNNALYVASGVLNADDNGLPLARPLLQDLTAADWARIFGPTQNARPGILDMSHVTVTNNTASTYAGLANGGRTRGDSVLVSSNSADSRSGVFNTRHLTLTNSNIVSNTALLYGSGFSQMPNPNPINSTTTDAMLLNVTISGNKVIGGYGAGILSAQVPNIPYTNSLKLVNVTLSNNLAISGSAITVFTGTVFARNSIIGNGISGINCYFVSGSITSLGHNLEDANTCGLNAMGDITNTAPLLGPLQDNGGATLTHPLLPNSPAIDAGDNIDCPPTDQRGVHRPYGRACDIGAFELQYPYWFPLLFNSP